MQVIPAVDVLDGKVVRLRRGDYAAVTVYSTDPLAIALGWIEQGAALVHVVDLEGARSGRPARRLWDELASAGVPFQVGGGIRDAPTARAALRAGAARVVLGTAAVWEPSMLSQIGEPDRVVAALDVKAGRAVGAGWLDEGKPLLEALAGIRAAGAPRILLTGIERDGTLEGSDLALVAEIRAAAPELAILASGGVGTLAHLRSLASGGVEGAVVGRALYERAFTLAEALKAAGRRWS